MSPLLAFVVVRPPLALVVAAGWVAVGGAVFAWHARAGRAAQAWASLVAWPVLLAAPRPVEAEDGPTAASVRAAVSGLRTALLDPAAVGLAVDDDLDALTAALLALDRRLALADRLLVDAGDGPARQALAAARARSFGDIVASLDELGQLRLQVGVLALGGDAGVVPVRLRALRHRLAAAEELAGHDAT